MLLRAATLYIMFVVATVAGGVAVWQTMKSGVAVDRMAEAARSLAHARQQYQAASDATLAAERRARIAEHDLATLQAIRSAEATQIDGLRAELAAARQQAAVAETAMTEAEDKLAAEIAAHAQLKSDVAGIEQRLKSKVGETPAVTAIPSPAPAVEAVSSAPPKPVEVSLPAAAAVNAIPAPHSEAVGAAAVDDAKAPASGSDVTGAIVESVPDVKPPAATAETTPSSKSPTNAKSAEEKRKPAVKQANRHSARPAASKTQSPAATTSTQSLYGPMF